MLTGLGLRVLDRQVIPVTILGPQDWETGAIQSCVMTFQIPYRGQLNGMRIADPPKRRK